MPSAPGARGVRLEGGCCGVVDTSWSSRSGGDRVHCVPAGPGVSAAGHGLREILRGTVGTRRALPVVPAGSVRCLGGGCDRHICENTRWHLHRVTLLLDEWLSKMTPSPEAS